MAGRLNDLGVNDGFMKEVARTLQTCNAALFLLVRAMIADRVMEGLQG